MSLPERADVVVVGGGLAGAALARFLADARTDVIGIDAGGPSVAAQDLGFAFTGLQEPAWQTASSLGPERTAALFKLSASSIALLAKRLPTARGGWWLSLSAREDGQLSTSARALAAGGVRVELVPDGPRGGVALRLPDEARLDGGDAVAAFRAGVRWFTDRVLRIENAGDRVHVCAEGGQVSAEVAVLAPGWRAAALDPWFEDKVQPVRQSASLFAPPPEPLGAGRGGSGYTWWAPVLGGLAVAGCRWATPHLEAGETDPVPNPRVLARLAAIAHERLGAGEALRSWAWIEAHTCDGLPIVGPLPGDPRRIACVGFNGCDTGLAVGAARLAADALLTGGRIPGWLRADRFQG